MKFELSLVLLVFCSVWRSGTTYNLTCGTQITLSLEPADLANLEVNANLFVVSAAPIDGETLDPSNPCHTDTTSITFNVTDCSPNIVRSGSLVVFNYKLFKVVRSGLFQGGIARYRTACVDFSCSFNEQDTLLITMAPEITKITDEVTAHGDFVFTIGMYASSSFVILLNSPVTVTIPDDVFVQISLQNAENTALRLRAQSCQVVKDPMTAMPSYEIISNYCESTPFANEAQGVERLVIMNEDSTDVQFRFRSFVFFEDIVGGPTQEYYIKCVVEVCDFDTGDCTATDSCGSRRKRSAKLLTANSNLAEQHSVTLGPLTFVNPK